MLLCLISAHLKHLLPNRQFLHQRKHQPSPTLQSPASAKTDSPDHPKTFHYVSSVHRVTEPAPRLSTRALEASNKQQERPTDTRPIIFCASFLPVESLRQDVANRQTVCSATPYDCFFEAESGGDQGALAGTKDGEGEAQVRPAVAELTAQAIHVLCCGQMYT